jgi:hypothetical protein
MTINVRVTPIPKKLLKNPPSTLRQAQGERREPQHWYDFSVRAELVEARLRFFKRPTRNLSTASNANESSAYASVQRRLLAVSGNPLLGSTLTLWLKAPEPQGVPSP